MHKTKDAGPTAGPATADAACPELAKLGLSAAEIGGLKKQAYVDSRRRGGSVYSRLRYRRDGKLQTIYIGCDAQRVASIKAELEQLQSGHRRQRELKRVVRRGKRTLQAVKRQLRPTLSVLGLHFHGSQIRRFRTTKRKTQTSNGESE